VKARDNPFRSDRVESVAYRFVDATTWDQLLARLDALQFRACVWGAEGSGKTTLLDELVRRFLSARFRIHLFTARSQQPPAGLLETSWTGEDLVIVDGADLLKRASLARLKKRTEAAGGLLITSHFPGLLPALYECRTSPQLLREVVAELIGADAARRLLLDQIYRDHAGDLRRALRRLYDLYAE